MSPSSQSLFPNHVGPYQLVETIGRGGMGSVHLALDTRHIGAQRWVAVKIIHPHLAEDTTFTAMFLDEARIASEVNHPNVCRVMDYGSDGSLQFLAMEYLCGAPLSDVRRRVSKMECDTRRLRALPGTNRQTSDGRRAAIMAHMLADACEGLHALHELTDEDGQLLGIVHRDVSPENLVVTCSGSTKVVDFGTVKARHQEHTTKSGAIKGKLSYLPPELLLNEPTDRRADIWALGVIAWELMTGQRLFKRSTEATTLQAVLDLVVAPPSSMRPDVPRVFDEVVLKALERNPARRYASARELGRALRRAGHDAAPGVDAGDVQTWLSEELNHELVCRRHGGGQVIGPVPPSMTTPSHAAATEARAASAASVTPASHPPTPMPARRWPAALLSAAVAAGVVAASMHFTSPPGHRQLDSYAHQAVLGTLTRVLGAQLATSTQPSTTPSPLVVELRDADEALVLRVPLDQLVLESADGRARRLVSSRRAAVTSQAKPLAAAASLEERR